MPATGYETEIWPVIEARHYKKVVDRKVRVIVIHTVEAPEGPQTAENVARYFATTATPASAHVCVDSDSVIQCVKDSHVAYAAPGCNHDGIQVELSGYARQSPADWRDRHSLALLAIAADITAQYCLKFAIPPVHLLNDELNIGRKGIVGHAQVSAVYKKSTHTDPGPHFPWRRFISMVVDLVKERSGQ